MDGRMLRPGGTGVAAYARALREAQRRIEPTGQILFDHPGSGRMASWGRRLRATVPLAAHATDAGRPDGDMHGRDLFRMAQVWFDVHRRLLPVRVPGPPGIIHWSYPVPLRILGWKNVYTVHDAIPLVQPSLSPIDPRRHRRLLEAIAREASRSGLIVTVSEAAAQEIVGVLPAAAASIVNCFQSVDIEDDPIVPLPNGLESDCYLLVCGSIERRKNIAAIVAGYRRSGVALPLVIAGPDAGDSLDIDLRNVIRLPAQEGAVMAALLARARALLMPSLAEGFGRPVVEAQFLGTPVLTSCSGALAEVAGDAALLVDPADEAAIGAGIRRIVQEAPLRAQLVAKGRVNADRFTPERFAARLATVYDGLIAPSA